MKAKARGPARLRQLTLRIPPELHKAVKVAAAQEGRTVAAMLTALMRQHLGGKRKRPTSGDV